MTPASAAAEDGDVEAAAPVKGIGEVGMTLPVGTGTYDFVMAGPTTDVV